jgi:thiol-disulfide isomerase/thioredoxin
MLLFWANWSEQCRFELPRLLEVHHKFHEQGFEVVCINFDEDRKHLSEVVRTLKLPWPQQNDGRGRENKLGKTFGIDHYPSVWLLDKKGEIRFISAMGDTEQKIGKLLAEATPADAPNPAAVAAKQRPAVTTPSATPAPAQTATPTARTGAVAAASSTKAGGAKPGTAAPAGPTNDDLSKALKAVQLKGFVARTEFPRAIIKYGAKNLQVEEGDEVYLNTPTASVPLRCIEIRTNSVLVAIPNTSLQRELHLQ